MNMKRLLLFFAAMLTAGMGLVTAQIQTVTFDQAVTICQALSSNETSSTTYRTTGVVNQVVTSSTNVDNYHNCDFKIADPTGANSTIITCFRTKWLNNSDMSSQDMPNEGDTVTVVGPLQNYRGTTVEVYTGYIESISRYSVVIVRDTIAVDPCGAISAAANLVSGEMSTDYYFVSGIVDTVTYTNASSTMQTFRMGCDAGSFFTAYNATMQGDIVEAGDYVQVFGRLQNYNGTIEISGGTAMKLTQPVANAITLGFQAPEEWDGVYIYYWNTSLDAVEWPGVQLGQDSLGWSYFTFPNDNTVNYIWNNGNGVQTVDLTAVVSKCERLGGLSAPGIYVTSFAECGSVAPVPVDTIPQDTIVPGPVDTIPQDTINPQPVEYYKLSLSQASVEAAEWDTVHLYVWNDSLQNYSIHGTWPGEIVELDSNGWYSASISADYAPFNIIWGNGHNGGGLNQTIDIRGVAADGCYSLRQGQINYNVALVDCDVVDTIVPDTSLYPVYFYDQLTRNFIDIQYVHAGEAATFPEVPVHEGYAFMGWDYYADMSHIYEVTGVLATYYLIMDSTHMGERPITVRLKASSVPEDWQQVNIFSWTVSDSTLNRNYGAPMQLDENGWYTYTLDGSISSLDLLFNNGEWGLGNQTNDIYGLCASQCLQIGAPLDSIGYHILYLADCEGVDTIAPLPVDTIPQDTIGGITVRLMKENTYGGWYGTYFVYAWQTIDSTDVPILGNWPGVEMAFDSTTNWYNYTFPAQYDNVNIIFSTDNGVQTVNIMNVTEDACFQVSNGLGYYNDMYFHNYVQVACDASIEYHLVYFYNMQGYLLKVVRVADGEEAVAPVAPEVPGYTFVGWDQDFSHVTEQMDVHPVYQFNGASGDGLTVKLLSTNGYGWENIYLYSWTIDSVGGVHQPLGSWPGVLIPRDSLGWHAYTFAEDSLVNIIWNDGISGEGYTHQTQNIENVSVSSCYRLYGKDSIGFTTAQLLDCDVNPADYHTIAFVDMDYNNELLLIGQVAHGSTFEYSPFIPQHEGISFLYWVDAATGAEYTGNEPITTDMLIDEMYQLLAYWVYLVDWDGTIIASGQIYYGHYVSNMDAFEPEREGYEFIGWSDNLENITSVRISVAQYRPLSAGNYTITYAGKDGEYIDTENVNLNVPVPPVYDGYIFVGWQVVGGSLDNGIQIQATYEYIGGNNTSAIDGDEASARKVIRDNHIYIIRPDGQIYSSDGKLVEKK